MALAHELIKMAETRRGENSAVAQAARLARGIGHGTRVLRNHIMHNMGARSVTDLAEWRTKPGRRSPGRRFV
jgi:hypothetical protein